MKFSQHLRFTLMCSSVLLTACGGSSSGPGITPIPTPLSTPVPTPTPSPLPVASVDFGDYQSSPYYPLASGRVLTYEVVGNNENVDDNETDSEDIQIQVHYTTQTQQIDGVNAVAVIEKEYEDDELVKASTKWVAMDVNGVVWLLGESSASYEDDEVDEEEIWTAGVEGAQRGLLMPETFLLGDSFTIEAISDEERKTGLVISVTESVSVEDLGDYDNVLHLEETSAYDDGTEVENKYYAPGIGLVRYIKDDDTVYELDTIKSAVELAIEIVEDTMPTASDEYGEFDDVNFEVGYDSDESMVSVAIKIELEDTALEELKIWDPEGELLAKFKAEELEDLGVSELFIKPGVGTLVVVSDELDEGTYTFLAETTNDEIIFGQAELNFDLLDAASIDLCDSIVDINNIVVSWGAVEDAKLYKIEISAEDDESDFELELEVSSDTNSFIIPESLLESDATYTVEVGAINDAGNITATQCEFSVN